MFLQKILHVRRTPSETQALLTGLQRFRPRLEKVGKALITPEGIGQFECLTPMGVSVHAVVAALPAGEENEVFFQSTAGNVEVAGLVEFVEVRPEVTEVQLTVEYKLKSFGARLLDFLTHQVERALDREFAALQACVEGVPAVSGGRSVARLPQLAH